VQITNEEVARLQNLYNVSEQLVKRFTTKLRRIREKKEQIRLLQERIEGVNMTLENYSQLLLETSNDIDNMTDPKLASLKCIISLC